MSTISHPSSTSCGLGSKTDKYRWELHSYGLPDGSDKLVVTDIIGLLIDALKGVGATDNELIQAHTKADHHNPSSLDAA